MLVVNSTEKLKINTIDLKIFVKNPIRSNILLHGKVLTSVSLISVILDVMLLLKLTKALRIKIIDFKLLLEPTYTNAK